MLEGFRTQSVRLDGSGMHSFAPVKVEELGFALSVFVAAANGTLVTPASERGRHDEVDLLECQQLLTDLLSLAGPPAPQHSRSPGQATLGPTFLALWRACKDDPQRESICARVLSFHLLMERTAGKAVERWVTACPDRPEEVLLDPAVVSGLATVPLNARTGLIEAHLTAEIDRAHHAACLT